MIQAIRYRSGSPCRRTSLTFMYPYAESEGKRVELKPGKPGYTISSVVLDSD